MAKAVAKVEESVTTGSHLADVPLKLSFSVPGLKWNSARANFIEAATERSARADMSHSSRLGYPTNDSPILNLVDPPNRFRDYDLLLEKEKLTECRALVAPITVFISDGGCEGSSRDWKLYRVAPRPVDPWAMRGEFLRAFTDQHLLSFLNRWGVWRPYNSFRQLLRRGSLDVITFERRWVDIVTAAELRAVQDRFRAALLGTPEEWLAEGMPLLLRGLSNHPIRDSFCHCYDVMAATITCDKTKRLRTGRCAREQCKNVWVSTNAHNRRYCSKACQHSELVRRSRDAKAALM